MMRAEHYREAERLLTLNERNRDDLQRQTQAIASQSEEEQEAFTEYVKGAMEASRQIIVTAQVHATLASCPIEAGHPGDYGVEQ